MAKKQEQELELKRQEEEIARENVNIFLKF